MFTDRELYLAGVLALLTALILYGAGRWRAARRRYADDDAELARTETFLAGLRDPVLKLRRVHPHGTLIMSEAPWKDARLILRPDGGAYETSWAVMTTCTFTTWCDDVREEIAGWAQEMGAPR
jgi:hypothetical protein